METRIIFEILFIFILPVILTYFKIVPLKFRLWLFFFLVFLVGFLSYLEGLTLKELGIRVDNLNDGVLPYTLLTLVGVALIVLAAKRLRKTSHPRWWMKPHFQFMFILLSVTQEFMYRGYLMPKLEFIIPSAFFVIFVNSLIFMFLHIIYPNKATNLLLTFIGGLAFAAIYYYYPNLFLISISHSILNFFAVLYGLVGFGEAKKLK